MTTLFPASTPPAEPLLVGTCGYSYPEWAEAGVYPAGVKSGKMLAHYAAQFPITELNHTWYQMPRAEAIERLRLLAPEGFPFTAKLTRTLTHEIDAKAWPAMATAYRDGLAPLVQAGQLVAVLAQFGPDFDRSLAHRNYLGALLSELEGLHVAVEFRHDSWVNDKVFAELERRRVSLVAVDEPALPGLFPALDMVTNPELFYVRFHGRNAKGWGAGKNAQFDYDYKDDELQEWTEKRLLPMAKKAKRGVIFFNNHVRGQAPKNARSLRELLAKYGLAGGGSCASAPSST